MYLCGKNSALKLACLANLTLLSIILILINFLKIWAIHYLIAKVCICSIQHFNQSKSKNFLFERKFYLRNVLQRSTTSDIQIYIMNLNYMHNHYHGEQFVEHVPGPLDRLSTSTKSLSTHKTYWMMRVWGCQFYISKK